MQQLEKDFDIIHHGAKMVLEYKWDFSHLVYFTSFNYPG